MIVLVYRVIVDVKRADDHKTSEYHTVNEGKLHHSAELCSCFKHFVSYMFLLHECINCVSFKAAISVTSSQLKSIECPISDVVNITTVVTHTHTHTQTRAHTQTRTQTRTHTHTHTHTQTRAHTDTHTDTRSKLLLGTV